MDLNDLLKINPNDTCIICGQLYSLAQLEKLGWEWFNNFVHIDNPPNCLVRYFRYNKKTVANLREGTVYLNDTEKFDDCFDCAVDLDWNKFFEERIKQYCQYFDVNIDDVPTKAIPYRITLKLNEYGAAQKAIDAIDDSLDDIQKLTITHFILYVFSSVKDSEDWVPVIVKEIQVEYGEFIDKFKHFKMSCFTTSPYLNRMWATNDSKGFCVEYEIDCKSELYVNLFPVIYSQKRNDFLTLSLNSDKKPSTDDLWQIYFNGLLRKSLHWVDQNEWRLIRYESDKKAKSIPFFKVRKVYIGNKMNAPERKVLIDICKEKGIPYVGIVRKPDSYDLVECPNKCDNCKMCQ